MINRIRNKLTVIFFLLLVVMIVFPITFTLAAVETLTLSVGQVEAQPGQSVTVPFVLESNPGISSLLVAISYDETRLRIDNSFDVRQGSALLGFMYVGPDENTISHNPFRAVWAGAFNNASTGVVLNIEFTVLENAPVGLATVDVEIEHASNVDMMQVSTGVISGGVNVRMVGNNELTEQTTPPIDTIVPEQVVPPIDTVTPEQTPPTLDDTIVPEQSAPPIDIVTPEQTPPTLDDATVPEQIPPTAIIEPWQPPLQEVIAMPTFTQYDVSEGYRSTPILEPRLLQRLDIAIENPLGIMPEFFVVYRIGEGDNEIIQKSMYDGESGIIRLLGFEDDLYIIEISPVGFYDVSSYDWYHNAVSLVAARRIFVGVGDEIFAPDSTMTKAMFITALSRLSGFDSSLYEISPFSDVLINSWYGASIAWAVNEGIIDEGILYEHLPGIFHPHRNITREQMAILISNYLSVNNFSLNSIDVPMFDDIDQAGYRAQEAIQVMRRYSIVSGVGNNLYNPLGESTRAEIAQIFSNLIKAILGLR